MNKKTFSKSLVLVFALVILFFSFCVIFPLLCVLFSAKPSDFKEVMTQPVWHQAMKNTFWECICSSTLSVLIGYIYAYAVVRGRIPCRKFFAAVPIIHLMTPPFVGGLAFIFLVGRQGFITHQLLGLNVSLYGFWGLLLAQVLCFFPMAYLICVQTLAGINPALEQAAKTLGASSAKIFWTIILPLSFTGIAAAFLFVAVSVLSDFGNPLIVAGRFRVLAVEIYTQLTGWLKVGTSAVLGIVLVIPSVALFLLQNRIYKKTSKKIEMVGGKNGFGFEAAGKTGKTASLFLFMFVLIISLCIIAQFAAIVAGSVQKLWGVNKTFTWEHLTAVGKYSKPLSNSIIFALLSAVLSTLVAAVASYLVHRTNMPLRKTIDVTAQLPSAIPGSLLGLALSLAASALRFNNSVVLIVIAMTVAFMPFSYRIITQTYAQIDTGLDDAARSLGSNQLGLLFNILIPVSSSGLYSGFVYDFIRGVGTLSAVIFLVSFNTPLASIKIINLAEQGDWGEAAALALVLTFITFAILLLGLLTGKFFQKRKLKKGDK